MFIEGYSEFSLSKAGVMYGGMLGAHFKLDNDANQLFPYINATFQDAKFYEKPEYIQFTMDDILCTLYPTDVIAAPFTGQNQAIQFVKHLRTARLSIEWKISVKRVSNLWVMLT